MGYFTFEGDGPNELLLLDDSNPIFLSLSFLSTGIRTGDLSIVLGFKAECKFKLDLLVKSFIKLISLQILRKIFKKFFRVKTPINIDVVCVLAT